MLIKPPSAEAMPTFSLIDNNPTEGYKATELIKDLLEIIGREVCTAKRNAQTSALLVRRAFDIYNKINALIEKAGLDDPDDWTTYGLYTTAIGPLQRSVVHVTMV
jgi:hypothetical protein